MISELLTVGFTILAMQDGAIVMSRKFPIPALLPNANADERKERSEKNVKGKRKRAVHGRSAEQGLMKRTAEKKNVEIKRKHDVKKKNIKSKRKRFA
jgi:hypothetical protein